MLGPAVGVAGSWAALEALKILTGKAPQEDLARFGLWEDERQFIRPPVQRCRFCTGRITEFLDARWSLRASSLCGLEGVQIRVNPPGALDLEVLQARLEARTGAAWTRSALALRGRDGACEVPLFRDGRALVHGPMTPERARGWYAEVVGC